MNKKLFDYTTDKREVYSYTLKKGSLEAEILDFGGTIRSLVYKGTDVVLGFDTVEDYINIHPYFGAIIGRYANRINNGRMKIEDREYSLYTNNGKNHLHGGKEGFDRKIWEVISYKEDSLILSYLSKDGEEGYPGNLKVTVEYIIKDDSLVIKYNAISDKDTVCNLTNHSYFNLNEDKGADILSHKLQINASSYIPLDETLIPTGEIKKVKGTVFDFTTEREIGDNELSYKDYDVNFCIDNGYPCAILSNGKITMEVHTDKPGVQVFSGSNTINLKGKNNFVYPKYAGICLETQFYPDSINNENFPSPILKAGESYRYQTEFKFKNKKA